VGEAHSRAVSRREFLKVAAKLGVYGAGMGPFFLFPDRSQATQKKLRILQYRHFVSSYDKWFDDVLAREWGQKHDTRVVDRVSIEKLRHRAAKEITARNGHDLVMFPSPPATFEKEVIDHRDIYRELRHQWGEAIELAHKSTFNPRTKKYFAFCDSYLPAPFMWLRDRWTEAGLPLGPIDYETLRRVGHKIRETRGLPCGFGMAEELSSNVALHSVLWSFGGAVHDQHGQVAINSTNTVEALKYMKAFYQDAEIPEVLRWGPSSNAKALLSGRISCTINAISLSREAESKKPAVEDVVMLGPVPRAHSDPLAPPHITQCYVIWNFSKNKEGAMEFLANLVANFMRVFQASEFCNFPCFPKTVPDLLGQLSGDARAVPRGKYAALRDTLQWTRNIGHPGYATAGVDEVFNSFVIPRMFGRVAKGELRPQEAAQAAEKEVVAVFSKQNQL